MTPEVGVILALGISLGLILGATIGATIIADALKTMIPRIIDIQQSKPWRQIVMTATEFREEQDKAVRP